MKKLPKSIKLTWHKGYKKDYPESIGAYAVMLRGKKPGFKPCSDFAIFIKETIGGHNFDRWRLLNNFFFGDVFIRGDIDSPIYIIDWASLKGDYE